MKSRIHKKTILLLLMLMATGFNTYSQKQEDRIKGRYRLPNQLEIEIFRNAEAEGVNTYEGKIVALNNFEKGQTKDENNPNRGERHKPLLGKVIIQGLKYDSSSGQWTDGNMYAPEKGMTVHLKVKSLNDTAAIAEASKLFFSKTVSWKKIP